jgi:hypothetical protein
VPSPAARARERHEMSPEQSLAELVAEARHATDRVALYRQRLYRGVGEPRRLAELERIASGARKRLDRRRAKEDAQLASGQRPDKVADVLRDVTDRLDAPDLSRTERMKLLQRQAALGDLRDELDLRARRHAGEGSRGAAER